MLTLLCSLTLDIPHSEANEYLRTVADVIARTVGGCDSVHLLYKGQKISLDCWIWELFDAKGDILNNMYYVKNLGAETNDENGGWHP